jgi:hypothetical protein
MFSFLISMDTNERYYLCYLIFGCGVLSLGFLDSVDLFLFGAVQWSHIIYDNVSNSIFFKFARITKIMPPTCNNR